MYPYIFWGSVYDEIDAEEREFSGCTFADSYAEAMDNIEDYYGEDLISIRLTPLEESSILEFTSKKEGKKIVEKFI